METLAIGVVRTSYGVRGEMKIRSLSGERTHFLKLDTAVLKKGRQQEQFEVERAREHGQDVVMKFKGIETPERARDFATWEVWVPRDRAAPLRSAEFYIADLCRCRLTRNGETVGPVRAVCEGGATELLEVELSDGRTVLVPFVDEYIGPVDLAAGTIELLVDWVLQ
jgi:16S rRNA processing protein RimM